MKGGWGLKGGHVETAPFGKIFSACYMCMFGTGKSRAAGAGTEERFFFCVTGMFLYLKL